MIAPSPKRRIVSAVVLAGGILGAGGGCGDALPPRRQVVLVVDTDAPASGDLAADPELSGAGAIDTVRIDVLDSQDKVSVFRELSAASALDWPFSFALVPSETGPTSVLTLRIRAFRARDAEPVTEGSLPTLAPVAELAIDRVVQITTPADGQVTRLAVHLSAECLGAPASFSERVSCQDAAHPKAAFGSPLPVADPGAPSKVGTSPLVRSLPCAQPAIAGRVCIPGGLSVLGSAVIAGLEDDIVGLPSLPMRLVRVSPFAMDETEVTVGRARPFLAQLKSAQPLGRGEPGLTNSSFCTLSADLTTDRLPLNCISNDTARELCGLLGGALPTEAEWNHAATGRGEARRFPWGDRSGECCASSNGRAVVSRQQECPGAGIEPASSHLPTAACHGIGDVSRDGVRDLGGSLNEVLADSPARLDDACWGPRFGVLLDPRCVVPGANTVATRGGSWESGTLTSSGLFRGMTAASVGRGFRCVYREAAIAQ